MKSCNSKTVETLKHWLSNSSTEQVVFAQKANAFSSHIYNIDIYTSPSEWTISKYSIPFQIIPDWFPPASKDIWATLIYKNTHEYIYISKTATNASRIILLDSAPSITRIYSSSSQVFSQFRSQTELALHEPLPTEMATRGTLHLTT